MVDCMVRPPVPGCESYELYKRETDRIYESLKRRALRLVAALNALDGISCQRADGAMYVFPAVDLPRKAVAEAKRRDVAPDVMYCMELLMATGICVVPGSGFGQADGTFHFRSTFLPLEDKVLCVCVCMCVCVVWRCVTCDVRCVM